jgi:excisionase family DNA binding protein
MESTAFNQYLTLQQTAEILNISLSTLYKLTSKKLIPHYKVNSRILFTPKEIKEYIERNKIEPIYTDTL